MEPISGGLSPRFDQDTGATRKPRVPVILLVEDDEPHSELIRRAFDRSATKVRLRWVSTLREAQQALSESEMPDLVITDLRLPDGEGLTLLPESRERAAYAVVVMTSHGDEKVAVEAMKTGALDYVVKSEESFARMPEIVERALRTWSYIVERRRAEEALRTREEHFRSLIENAHDLIATDPGHHVRCLLKSEERREIGRDVKRLLAGGAASGAIATEAERAAAEAATERALAAAQALAAEQAPGAGGAP